MDYRTIDSKKELNSFVKCHWILNAPKEKVPVKQRIVPDGCIELIFHYGDLFRQYAENGDFILQPKCFVFGQITKPLNIEPTGVTGVFASRFHPDGFIPFSKIPLAEMTNRAVPLNLVFGDIAANRIQTKMLNAKNTLERLDAVETFLSEMLMKPESINRLVKNSVNLVLELKGQVSVVELTKQLSTERRQLERKCLSVIGLSPKQFSKIVRLQATLKMLLDQKFTNLTTLALEGGYYDQAHFIKDFKEFTGVSPRRFYSNNLKLSSFFVKSE